MIQFKIIITSQVQLTLIIRSYMIIITNIHSFYLLNATSLHYQQIFTEKILPNTDQPTTFLYNIRPVFILTVYSSVVLEWKSQLIFMPLCTVWLSPCRTLHTSVVALISLYIHCYGLYTVVDSQCTLGEIFYSGLNISSDFVRLKQAKHCQFLKKSKIKVIYSGLWLFSSWASHYK